MSGAISQLSVDYIGNQPLVVKGHSVQLLAKRLCVRKPVGFSELRTADDSQLGRNSRTMALGYSASINPNCKVKRRLKPGKCWLRSSPPSLDSTLGGHSDQELQGA
ncbi:hypothetical protein CSKR_201494 [Clonorchis sinensis]|uniref:Uncharacterized protein n=1 Tax=Clonorchis sinensis TaxID=79923 RepID=A0A8T1MS24_CLOSI|nr:hypothetical protein CSKR_201494 [Clonorchis sinensis]